MLSYSPVFLQTLMGGLEILCFFWRELLWSMYQTQAASASHRILLEPSPHEICVLSYFMWTYIFILSLSIQLLKIPCKLNLEALKTKKYIYTKKGLHLDCLIAKRSTWFSLKIHHLIVWLWLHGFWKGQVLH